MKDSALAWLASMARGWGSVSETFLFVQETVGEVLRYQQVKGDQ